MEHTEYHQLCLWDPEDRILREDFNSDNAKTEAALADLTEAVAGCGNCKIEYGSYTGTGNYSSAHPNSLTFSGQPLLVLVADTTRGSFLLMMRSATFGLYVTADSEGIGMPHLNWETDCAVSWYSGGPSSVSQANGGGRKYVYIALIAADA